MASEATRTGRRTGGRHADAAERRVARTDRPCVPVHGASRNGQDEHSPHHGQGRQLPRPAGRGAGRYVRHLPVDQRGPLARPHRDRRRQQPRHRRHSRSARQGRVHPPRGPLQGLHHRRSPHAHRAGIQRALEDPRRAARPRHLHPRHNRNPQGPAHHHLSMPAVRLPSNIPRYHPNAAGHSRTAGGPHRRAGGARVAREVVIGQPARCREPARTGDGILRLSPPR